MPNFKLNSPSNPEIIHEIERLSKNPKEIDQPLLKELVGISKHNKENVRSYLYSRLPSILNGVNPELVNKEILDLLLQAPKDMSRDIRHSFYLNLPQFLEEMHTTNSKFTTDVITQLLQAPKDLNEYVRSSFYFFSPILLRSINKINPKLKETLLNNVLRGSNDKNVKARFVFYLKFPDLLKEVDPKFAKKITSDKVIAPILKLAMADSPINDPNEIRERDMASEFYSYLPKFVDAVNKINPDAANKIKIKFFKKPKK